MIPTGIQAALSSTVRVNGGTGIIVAQTPSHAGVIATAQHVLTTEQVVRVRWRDGESEVDVVARDPELDVALVAVPRELEDRGVQIGPCELGDEAWLLGYPIGWTGDDALLSRGFVSGLLPRVAWIDGSVSWGHSGGPAIVLRDDVPVVVGTVVGDASRAHDKLQELIRLARQEQQTVEAMIADRVSRGRVPEPALGLAAHSTTRVRDALELVRMHFRAGFIEVVRGERLLALRGD
jgi:Trypsin-like peptidase domain